MLSGHPSLVLKIFIRFCCNLELSDFQVYILQSTKIKIYIECTCLASLREDTVSSQETPSIHKQNRTKACDHFTASDKFSEQFLLELVSRLESAVVSGGANFSCLFWHGKSHFNTAMTTYRLQVA